MINIYIYVFIIFLIFILLYYYILIYEKKFLFFFYLLERSQDLPLGLEHHHHRLHPSIYRNRSLSSEPYPYLLIILASIPYLFLP